MSEVPSNGKPKPLIVAGYSSQALAGEIAAELGSRVARVTDHRQAHAHGNGIRGKSVPQVMNVNILNSSPFTDFLPSALQVVDRFIGFVVRANHIRVSALARYLPKKIDG